MLNGHRVSITFSLQNYFFPIHTAQTLTRFSDANAKAWVTSDVVAQRMIKARVLAWAKQTFADDQFVLPKQDVASNVYSVFVQFLVLFPFRSLFIISSHISGCCQDDFRERHRSTTPPSGSDGNSQSRSIY